MIDLITFFAEFVEWCSKPNGLPHFLFFTLSREGCVFQVSQSFLTPTKKGMDVQSTVDTFFEESNLEKKKTGHSGTRILDAPIFILGKRNTRFSTYGK